MALIKTSDDLSITGMIDKNRGILSKRGFFIAKAKSFIQPTHADKTFCSVAISKRNWSILSALFNVESCSSLFDDRILVFHDLLLPFFARLASQMECRNDALILCLALCER
jgi:hypothetical protein